MKKQSIYSLLILGICTFCACSSNDDTDDINSLDGQSFTNPGVYGPSHKRLTSWAGVKFFYYDNGGIDSIAPPTGTTGWRSWGGTGNAKFSQDQKKRWVYELLRSRSWRDYTSDIFYNKQGYITEMNSVPKEYDADHNIGNQVFFYDKNGHLTQTAKKSNDGNYYGYQTIVWENDTIVKIIDDKIDGEKAIQKGFTFEYGGGVNRNECLQYDGSLIGVWMNQGLQELFILGFFGKGPKYLPTKIIAWQSGKIRYETELTYKFNLDGTISKGYGGYGSPNQEASYSYK